MEESSFAGRLLKWFGIHGRKNLPWQENPSLYRVWVSEVMLQQTQVVTVIPYYQRFMARFPTVTALAAAPLDEVLHLWAGLGYYARARNLHLSAQRIVQTCSGQVPQDFAALRDLPGIGRSTAGAILALACAQRHAILDGNVKRVLARVFGIEGDPSTAEVSKALWLKSEECTPTDQVNAYTQAIMDLGATVCTRTRPACTLCPFIDRCVAAREGRQSDLPGRKKARARPSRTAVLLIAQCGEAQQASILVERRPANGLWGGLWSPPQFDSDEAALAWCGKELGTVEISAESLAPIDHAFTHFDLQLLPLRVRVSGDHGVRDDSMFRWYPIFAPPRLGLPQPIRILLAQMAAELGGSR